MAVGESDIRLRLHTVLPHPVIHHPSPQSSTNCELTPIVVQYRSSAHACLISDNDCFPNRYLQPKKRITTSSRQVLCSPLRGNILRSCFLVK
jgi:hypothetical protein